MFLDESIVRVRSGKGGNGCVSFRREKFIPRGGPNGGDGGHGGSVYLASSTEVSTLLDLGRKRSFAAESGRPGEGSNRHGRRGRDLVLTVPVGTVVRDTTAGEDPRAGKILADFDRGGHRVCVVRGGRGGRGNKAFATATHRVPRQAEEGGSGDERTLYLELKLIADAGLVGLPNAGKSTLLSRLSAATPKVAAYPFTTLQPHLGIVELGDFARFVLADLPGLIEGAHQGHGLGIEFLRHIERTRVLIHLVSAEPESLEELLENHRVIEHELASYSETLAGKSRLVVLTKIDVMESDQVGPRTAELSRAIGSEVFPVSAVTGQGLPKLVRALGEIILRRQSEILVAD